MKRPGWWTWIPLPLARWRVVLEVENADEIPERLPPRGAALVGSVDAPKWVAFDCPCGDGHRIMLNLDQGRRPYWRATRLNPLSLHPSIDDRSVGHRRCHFLMLHGRVKWVP